MSKALLLPGPTHDAVMQGPFGEMIVATAQAFVPIEKIILEVYGKNRGHLVSDAVTAMAFCHLSRMAWSLVSAAEVRHLTFDPVEFGKEAERIAREQIERYRATMETAGRA